MLNNTDSISLPNTPLPNPKLLKSSRDNLGYSSPPNGVSISQSPSVANLVNSAEEEDPSRLAKNFNFNLPTVAIFTGTGQPFTRTLSLKFAERLAKGSIIVLSSHNLKMLESHAHYIRSQLDKQCRPSTPRKSINFRLKSKVGNQATTELTEPTEPLEPNQKVQITCTALDYNVNTDSISEKLRRCFTAAAGTPSQEDDARCSLRHIKQAIVFHNAGRITLSKKPQDFAADEMANYFKHNVISTICLNTVFLEMFRTGLAVIPPSPELSRQAKANKAIEANKSNETKEVLEESGTSTCKSPSRQQQPALFPNATRIFVVNVSSPLALTPFPGLGLGCASKAARDIYFRVVAIENPELMVLNYSPGPIRFETWQTLVDSTYNDKIKRENLLMIPNPKGAASTGTGTTSDNNDTSSFMLIDSAQSVRKLLNILERCSYKSGDHIEYHNK